MAIVLSFVLLGISRGFAVVVINVPLQHAEGEVQLNLLALNELDDVSFWSCLAFGLEMCQYACVGE